MLAVWKWKEERTGRELRCWLGTGRRAFLGRGLEARLKARHIQEKWDPKEERPCFTQSTKVLLMASWKLVGRPLGARVAPRAWSKDPSDNSATPDDPTTLPFHMSSPALFHLLLSRLSSL